MIRTSPESHEIRAPRGFCRLDKGKKCSPDSDDGMCCDAAGNFKWLGGFCHLDPGPGHTRPLTLWILLKFLPPEKGRKKSFQRDPKGSFSHWTKGHLDYQGFEYVWTYFSWRVGRIILTQSALLDTHHGPLLTSQSQSQFEAQSILIGFGIQCRTCIQAPLGELRPIKRSLGKEESRSLSIPACHKWYLSLASKKSHKNVLELIGEIRYN